jgi:ribonuclease P protein component
MQERPRHPATAPPQRPQTADARVSATFRQHERVTHGFEFRRARAEGRRLTGRLMLINVFRAESLAARRLGVVTSRDLGDAVTRNRARRVMREAWRLLKDRIAEPCDIVMVARRGIVGRSMQDVQQELVTLLRTAGVLRDL